MMTKTTGGPHKRRVWLFVRNIMKCMEKNIEESYVIRSLLLITYSNSQRKTHQIAQIRPLEPQKRQ